MTDVSAQATCATPPKKLQPKPQRRKHQVQPIGSDENIFYRENVRPLLSDCVREDVAKWKYDAGPLVLDRKEQQRKLM